MKKFFTLLIFFVALSLVAAEQMAFLTIPWKPIPDQTELFARSGKMYDVSCNEYALTFYAREQTAGKTVRVLIAPGSEMDKGYVAIHCQASPKRSLKADFCIVPDLFSEMIETEVRQDGTGQYVYRITVPWENVSAILPEKGLRLMLGPAFLPLQMPNEYFTAKQKIERTIFTAFQQKTYLKIHMNPEKPFRENLKQYLDVIKKDPAVRVRYLRAILTEVTP